MDLLTVLSQGWQDALDEGLDTLVIALDIVGAFDRVWHAGLVEKLRAKGIQGSGRASQPSSIQASVPQGSMLGPILWNIHIDDRLRQISILLAYTDDCTLSQSYSHSDSQKAVSEINKHLRIVAEWGET